MRKSKVKQPEMFTTNDMIGNVVRRDIFMEEYVAAYLKYMQRLSELDDDTCRIILNECETINGNSEDGTYRIKTLHCSINVIHFVSLKEMLNMRLYSAFADEYSHHDEGIYHIYVSFPSAFAEARKIFKEKYSAKYDGRDTWVTDKSESELL